MTATDTELVKHVFNSVTEIIFNEILKETDLNLQKASANITSKPTS